MARTNKYSDAEIITALENAHGLVYMAADALGCEAKTIYLRMENSEKVAEAAKRGERKIIQKAIDNVCEKVAAGDWKATQYLLDKKGHLDGFGARGEEIDEELRELREAVQAMKEAKKDGGDLREETA
jgi:hypothetical protein